MFYRWFSQWNKNERTLTHRAYTRKPYISQISQTTVTEGSQRLTTGKIVKVVKASIFPTCHCHEIYWLEAVGLKTSNST